MLYKFSLEPVQFVSQNLRNLVEHQNFLPWKHHHLYKLHNAVEDLYKYSVISCSCPGVFVDFRSLSFSDIN